MPRHVLVTGGTRGIGLGIARAFAACGDRVVVCSRREPETALPSGVEFVACDVRDPDQVAAMVEGIGRLDVAINNAGGSPPADAATASPRFSSAIVTLNLLAPLYVAQAAYGAMTEGGSIINIGSVSGMRPSPGTAAYGAAKAGLVNLTSSLAIEWAPRVRVNCISAGLVRTEQAELHYGDEAAQQRVADTVPMGRLATADDLAQACLFLAGDGASYITGANLVLHGGGERPAYLEAVTASDHAPAPDRQAPPASGS